MKKLLQILPIVLFFSFGSAMAQSTAHVMEGNELNDALYKNVKAGLPEYTGMNDQYTYTTDNLGYGKLAASQLISEIKQLDGVVDCFVELSSLHIIVQYTKPANKFFYENDMHVADIKQLLDQHHIRMTEYKRVTIKK